jgi:hypothetical protein
VDLALYARVLWRFRFLVVLGLLGASMLALFLMVEVRLVDGSPRFSYRQSEQWQSQATLLITEPGFPEGRKAPNNPQDARQETSGAAPATPLFADPHRFASLAVLYAHLLRSDSVLELLRSRGPIDGTLDASARASQAEGSLPFVDVLAVSDSPAASMSLATRAAEALRDEIAREQTANGIAADERVLVTMVGHPRSADLTAGRPKAAPVVAFLAVMLLAVAVAFVYENLRPRSLAAAREVHPSHP